MVSERVQRRQEATRERIVQEAMRLFEQQGFDSTTVAQISEAADIGKGTFFTYFPAKGDVFTYLSEQVVDAMAAADDPGLGPEERARRCFAAAGAWFDEHEVLARQMVLARLRTVGQLGASPFRGRLLDLLADIVQAGRGSGRWGEASTADLLQALAGVYFVSVAAWASSSGDRTLSDRLAAQLDILFTGLWQ